MRFGEKIIYLKIIQRTDLELRPKYNQKVSNKIDWNIKNLGFLISRNLVRVLISETNNYSGKSHLKWPKHEDLNRDVSFDLATAIFSPSLQQTKPEGRKTSFMGSTPPPRIFYRGQNTRVLKKYIEQILLLQFTSFFAPKNFVLQRLRYTLCP